VNVGKLFKVFDTVISVFDATKEHTAEQAQQTERQTPAPGLADQVEMRLTNIVVAALKEAFNRDDARIELERAHLEEQRRRAEEARRLELRRQAIDRETGRLRLLAAAALIGWLASLVLLMLRHDASSGARAFLISAALLSLCSLGSAFIAQASMGTRAIETDTPLQTPAAAVSLWVLFAGLASASAGLLL
jgi:hypothetical protein